MNSLDEADRLLDEGLFSQAREAFRRIALTETPEDVVLWNLALAEIGEIIDFRRALIKRFPTSTILLLDEIQKLIDVRHSGTAFVRCSSLLSVQKWEPREELRIRRLRLNASIASGKADFLSDDFFFLWKFFPSNNNYQYYVIVDLSKVICSITNPLFLPQLSEIANKLQEDGDCVKQQEVILVKIVESKINQLEYIQAARALAARGQT